MYTLKGRLRVSNTGCKDVPDTVIIKIVYKTEEEAITGLNERKGRYIELEVIPYVIILPPDDNGFSSL